MNPTAPAPALAALHQSLLRTLIAPLRRVAHSVASEYRGADADDLHQIGLEAAWRLLPRYDGSRAGVLTFVYPRARGAMVDACRKALREACAEPQVEDAHADGAPSVQALLEAEESIERLLACLPPKDREIVILRKLAGYELREAAETLGLDYKCAWVRLDKAMKRLASVSEHEGRSARRR